MKNQTYTCIFITTYYFSFLNNIYNNNPTLKDSAYQNQLDFLLQTHFGDSEFYSSHLTEYSWNCHDIILNAENLQYKWAEENTIQSKNLEEIALEQIKSINPDVIYLHDLHISPEFIMALKEHCSVLVGQIACAISETIPFLAFDILISSIHEYVDLFRANGIKSYYQPLAFEPKVLNSISSLPFDSRPIPVSFVGGLEGFSPEFLSMLERLAEQNLLFIWGYGIANLAENSPLRQVYQGEAWSDTMFEVLSQSKITINRHRDFAYNSANNMRLYEATACGALLLTEQKDNLNDLFEIGKEVLAYRSIEECLDLIYYMLRYPLEATQIANAGKQRTLTQHTYTQNMAETNIWLRQHLRHKEENPLFTQIAQSTHCVDNIQVFSESQVTQEILNGWQAVDIPLKQRAINVSSFEATYQGRPTNLISALYSFIKPILKKNSRIIEIGCSSGLLVEHLEYLFKKKINYTGLDYSESFIDMAKDYYPSHTFIQADGACTPFNDATFDIVISGCVILHTPHYSELLKEACRLSSKYLILHKTPYLFEGQTQIYHKLAYGTEVAELWFNRNEILNIMEESGFTHLQETYLGGIEEQNYSLTELFIKK